MIRKILSFKILLGLWLTTFSGFLIYLYMLAVGYEHNGNTIIELLLK